MSPRGAMSTSSMLTRDRRCRWDVRASLTARAVPVRGGVRPSQGSSPPVGALDLATVPLVDAKLGELWSVGFTRLALDLRDVEFLDSTAVRMLWSWHSTSEADGIAFGVIPGPEVVQRVLEVAGVAERLAYWSPDSS